MKKSSPFQVLIKGLCAEDPRQTPEEEARCGQGAVWGCSRILRAARYLTLEREGGSAGLLCVLG